MLALLTLFAAFAPAISLAMSVVRAAESGLIPVCTQAGMKWMDVRTGEVRNASDDAGQLERCPLCVTHNGGPPPAERSVAEVLPSLRDEVPFLFDHAPRPLFAWLHAPSRAPPFPT